jgi:arylsulfatase A-like enzyme
MLEQTISLAMSIREGKWKYLDHKGSGGNNYDRDDEWSMRPYKLEDTDPEAPGQLYDLDSDPGERVNLYNKHPEIVAKLKGKLAEFKNSGRSALLNR